MQHFPSLCQEPRPQQRHIPADLNPNCKITFLQLTIKGKGKVAPLQAWSGSEGCRKLKQSRYRPGVAQRVAGI
jgi:hypothetical protein